MQLLPSLARGEACSFWRTAVALEFRKGPDFARGVVPVAALWNLARYCAFNLVGLTHRVNRPAFSSPLESNMDTTTLLIIVIALLVLGGGGYWGRGRWF